MLCIHIDIHDSIDDIPNEHVELIISDQLYFEMLLLEIRGKTISYASYKKKQETEREQQRQDELRLLEETINDNCAQQSEKIKVQLQEIRNKRMEGITILSRVNGYMRGRQLSRYVL